MQSVIWKFPVKPEMSLSLPRGAQILTVQSQHGTPQMWVQIDTEAPPREETRHFVAFGTGDRFDSAGLTYIGTFQVESGMLVFHLYERTEVTS